MQGCVTTNELTAAQAAGIDCFFWFENSNDPYRPREGYAAGVADAKEALQALASLGVPTATPVYYTVDFNISNGNEIDAYFRGIASLVPVSQIGAYGQYTTIDWLYQHRLATYFCQTTAWMDGRGWHPAAQMHQDTSSYSIGGIAVDRLTVTTAQFGQYPQSATPGGYEPSAVPGVPLRYEQSDSNLVYTGAWSPFAVAYASPGTYSQADTNGASVVIPFNGERLDWIAAKGPTMGKALVSIDGQAPTTVDLASDAALLQQDVWSTGTLPAGLHTVTISWDPANVPGTYVDVDAVDVLGSLVAATRFEQTDPRLQWSGGWTPVPNDSSSGGSYERAAGPASVTINFTGLDFTLIGDVGPHQGEAKITVDGGTPLYLDCYTSIPLYNQVLWTTGCLPPGNHTVIIEWTGQKQPSAAASRITVDAVAVIGELR